MPRITWRYFIILRRRKKEISHRHTTNENQSDVARYFVLLYVFRIQCAIFARLHVQILVCVRERLVPPLQKSMRSFLFIYVRYEYVFVCDLTLINKIDCTQSAKLLWSANILPTHVLDHMYARFSCFIHFLNGIIFPFKNEIKWNQRLPDLRSRKYSTTICCFTLLWIIATL